MKRLFVILLVVIVSFAVSAYSEVLTVPEEYNLLTEDEIENGVMLDHYTMFAYTLMDDNTILLIRYTWVRTHVSVPSSINGIPVSALGAYAFLDTPVREIELPCGIATDSDAFSYSEVETVFIVSDRSENNK